MSGGVRWGGGERGLWKELLGNTFWGGVRGRRRKVLEKKALERKKWKAKKTGGNTIYDLVRDLSAPLLLVMLDQPVRIHRVGDGAVEVEGDAGGAAVGGHEGGVFLHALLGGAVLGVLVPFVFVLAFLGGGGVELVGGEFEGEGDVLGGGEGCEFVEGCWGGVLGRMGKDGERMGMGRG